MANNRLYFKFKRTGEKVLLAKYYPSTGWYVFYDDFKSKLDALFNGDDFGTIGAKCAVGGMYDDGVPHELEYEIVDSEHLENKLS